MRLQLSGSDISSLRAVGTLSGVVVLAVAALNGPGQGMLVKSPAGLAWQAPGSPSPGPATPIPADGSYLIEDAGPSKWARVQVYTSYLASTGQAAVNLTDRYNPLGPSDVAAADALAGLVTTTEYTLTNFTGYIVRDVLLWVTAGGVSVSLDGTTFVTPSSRTDPDVLTWATIAAPSSVNVWIRRTIAATTASTPSVLNSVQFVWRGF